MDPLTFARHLRSAQTDAETLLWSRLRAHRLMGLKFRRQQPVGPYVVDFYCPEKKLIVELDGGQHLEQAKYDASRDAWLNPDCPLGGPTGLRAPWRPSSGIFASVLLAHRLGYGLVARPQICSKAGSPSSRVLMNNLG
jgi:very-short-patch-repair endonuclease